MQLPLGVALLLTCFTQIASSQTAPRPVLVELFTSEGCSSCPPADALLERLNGRKTDAGQLIVGISEHVTYWNRLGWADPFSQESFTARQNAYGDRFHLDSVYTPQIVVDGDTQVLGSDAAAVDRAVSRHKAPLPLTLQIDRFAVQPEAGTVSFTCSLLGPDIANLDLFAVIIDDGASSRVSRGENAGRTLHHVAVARSFTKLPGSAATQVVTLKLPPVLPGQNPTGRQLLVFAQTRGSGPMLGFTSRKL